jgi:nicotinate-nucleotide adenylyltransferase
LKPIGILGGTFNPVHFGHLRIAEELGDALDLDEVRLMPANMPPLRTVPAVSGAERLHMVGWRSPAIAGWWPTSAR